MVASNVLRGADGRVVLIDWEHSRPAPVMVDGAKLHLFSATPDRTLEQVLTGLASGPAAQGASSPAHDLALAHASFISRYPRRRAQLEGHHRLEVYERQVRRQAARLAQVLGLG